MTRSRVIANLPDDLMATYYGERSGAGFTEVQRNRIVKLYEQSVIENISLTVNFSFLPNN